MSSPLGTEVLLNLEFLKGFAENAIFIIQDSDYTWKSILETLNMFNAH